jgi:hypothetical protein
VLSMRKTGSRRFSASPDFLLDRYDEEVGSRLTIGYVPDCVSGYEFSYTGRFQWDRAASATDAAGGLGTLLFAVAPVVPANLSAFNNATAQAQFETSEYWSLEASNTKVGWDVAKLICGLRYISYDEDFTILSQTATESGFLRSAVENQLIGFQVGMDLLYPVCRNTYTDLRARAGVYANFIDLDLRVINAGTTTAALLDDSTKLAGQLEFGSGLRYQFCEMLSVRGGFDLWYLSGVAAARDQFRDGILARREVRGKDDFLVVGLSLGAVFRY